MRSLLFLCILLSCCSKSQTGIFMVSSGTVTPKNYTAIGTLISDNFTGTSLNSSWTVNGTQTTSVNNGLTLTGSTTGDNMATAINNTGYGKSMLRNYTISQTFTPVTIGSAGNVFVGPESQNDKIAGTWFASYTQFDLTNGTLQIVGDSARTIKYTAATGSSGLTINTSSNYTLSYTMNEDVITATIKNNTLNQTYSLSYQIGFTTVNADPIGKPNIFYYSFGASGNSTVKVSNVTVTSPEYTNPDYVFLGNSISTGYFTGTATNAYAYKLRSNTSAKIQVMAGGGNFSQDMLDDLSEVIARHPSYLFLEIGTNDIGHSIATSTIESHVSSIISQLTGAGITVYTTSAPNGGSPSTAGTYNNWLSNNTNFINDYSNYNGTNTVDGIHFNSGGSTIEAATIKAALPALFPN